MDWKPEVRGPTTAGRTPASPGLRNGVTIRSVDERFPPKMGGGGVPQIIQVMNDHSLVYIEADWNIWNQWWLGDPRF